MVLIIIIFLIYNSNKNSDISNETLIVKLNERVEKDAAENPLIVGMISVISSLLKRTRENLLQKYLSNMKNPET